jgi:hypothetical protein
MARPDVLAATFRPKPHGGAEKASACMTRAGTKILDSADTLPTLSIETVGHGRLPVPDHFGQGWGVFLLYRAHW